MPIRPGTDGALILALCHELLRLDLYDREFVVDYSNAAHLINADEASNEFGLAICDPDDPEHNPHRRHSQLWWDERTGRPVRNHTDGAEPLLFGDRILEDGTPVKTAFELLRLRLAGCTPDWAAAITGISADTIRRLAREMGTVAREQSFELPIAWTDSWGRRHDSVIGRPVAFHAMRGLAAHSNGFQSIRALSVLMTLLGTIDRPGGFRHKAPFPRAAPPVYAKNPNSPDASPAEHAAAGRGAGIPGRSR